jgi:putative endonuclease
MSKTQVELGQKGERIAVSFLKNEGYRIIAVNYRTRLGQIDIVAKDKGTICFVEVKTRKSQRFGKPAEAVGVFKQRKISQVALAFLKQNGLLNSPARFDVVSISHQEIHPKVELIKNAFELDYNYTY